MRPRRSSSPSTVAWLVASWCAAAAPPALAGTPGEDLLEPEPDPEEEGAGGEAGKEEKTERPDPYEGAERIGYEELVREVEKTSPLMAAARAGLEVFEAKLHEAKAGWHPVFTIEAGGIVAPQLSGEGLDVEVDFDRYGYLYRTRVTLVQPLFTFGKLSALKEAARRGLDVGAAMIEAARWELRYRAAEAYYGALLARELRLLLDEGKRWLDRAEARMAKLKAEDSDDYDQLEHLRLKTRTAEFFELEAQNRLLETSAHEGLRVLLDRPEGTAVRPRESALELVPVEILPVERYLALARETEPKLRMARAEARARHALADARANERWPDVFLLGDARLTDSDLVGEDAVVLGNEALGLTGGALLGFRWKLDFGLRNAKTEEARAEAVAASRKADVQDAQVEMKVRELHRKLADKREIIDVYETSRKAAQGWMTATWDLYDTGFGSFRDVMDALVQFYGKKLGYLRAVHEFDVLVAEMSRAVGRDVAELGEKKVNEGGRAPSKGASPEAP